MELKNKTCESKMVDALRGGSIMIGIAKRVQKQEGLCIKGAGGHL